MHCTSHFVIILYHTHIHFVSSCIIHISTHRSPQTQQADIHRQATHGVAVNRHVPEGSIMAKESRYGEEPACAFVLCATLLGSHHERRRDVWQDHQAARPTVSACICMYHMCICMYLRISHGHMYLISIMNISLSYRICMYLHVSACICMYLHVSARIMHVSPYLMISGLKCAARVKSPKK